MEACQDMSVLQSYMEQEEDQLDSLKQMLLEKENQVQELQRAIKTMEFKFKLQIKNLTFADQKQASLLSESKEKIDLLYKDLDQSRSDQEKQQTKIAKLKDQKTQLEGEMQKALTHYKALKEDIRQWERILPSVQFLQHIGNTIETASTYQSLYESKETCASAMCKLEEELRVKGESLDGVQMKVAELNRELLENHNQLHDYQQLQALHKEQVLSLESKVGILQEEVDLKTREKKELERRLQEQQRHREDLEQLNNSDRDELVSKLNSAIKRTEDSKAREIEELSRHYGQRWQQMLQSMEKLQEESMQAHQRQHQAQRLLSDKQSQLHKLKQAESRLSSQVDRLSGIVSQQQQLILQTQESLIQSQSTLDSAQKQILVLEQQIKEKSKHYETTQTALHDVRQALSSKEGKCNQLRLQLSKKTGNSVEQQLLKRVQEQADQYKQQMQAARAQIKQVEGERDKGISECQGLKQKMEALKVENDGLKEMVQEYKGEHDSTALQLAKVKSTLSQLQSTARESSQTQLRQKEAEWQQKITSLAADKDKAKSQAINLQREVFQLKEEKLLFNQEKQKQRNQQLLEFQLEKTQMLKQTSLTKETLDQSEKRCQALKQQIAELLKKYSRKKQVDQQTDVRPETSQQHCTAHLQQEVNQKPKAQQYVPFNSTSSHKILRPDNSMSILVNFGKILAHEDSQTSIQSEPDHYPFTESLRQLQQKNLDLEKELKMSQEQWSVQREEMLRQIDYYGHELAVNKVRYAQLAIECQQKVSRARRELKKRVQRERQERG